MSDENLKPADFDNKSETGSASNVKEQPEGAVTGPGAVETVPEAEPQKMPAESAALDNNPTVLDSQKKEENPSEEKPQVIIQKERSFAYYVGFALLCVLCLFFYFIPGISLTYAINMIPGVSFGGIAGWILGAIFSVIIWLIIWLMTKQKIKGFKKSFYIYIGLCIVVFGILVAIQVTAESSHIFSNIIAMLTGAAN